jgi:hypothetical protein
MDYQQSKTNNLTRSYEYCTLLSKNSFLHGPGLNFYLYQIYHQKVYTRGMLRYRIYLDKYHSNANEIST